MFLLTLAAGTIASAHRRDEFLQAARVAIDPDRVRIELDLTPGISVADAVLKDIDRDRNGSISAVESAAYAARVLSAVSVDIDAVALSPRIVDTTFPDVGAIRHGEGTIRIRLTAEGPRLGAGAHRLRYRNAHQPDMSVYLANALVPADARVAITGQDRDADQRTLQIDYVVAPDATRRRRSVALVTPGLVVLALMWARRRRSLTTA